MKNQTNDLIKTKKWTWNKGKLIGQKAYRTKRYSTNNTPSSRAPNLYHALLARKLKSFDVFNTIRLGFPTLWHKVELSESYGRSVLFEITCMNLDTTHSLILLRRIVISSGFLSASQHEIASSNHCLYGVKLV